MTALSKRLVKLLMELKKRENYEHAFYDAESDTLVKLMLIPSKY